MKPLVVVLFCIAALLLSAVVVISLPNVVSANMMPIHVPKHDIEIKVDGSVTGTGKIQCNDTLYTFTEDINGSIVVFRDDIIIDGAGHALYGNGTSAGFFLQGRYNVTIKNVRISNFSVGIEMVPRYEIQGYEVHLPLNTNFTLQGNTIANTNWGIYNLFAEDVTISGNILRDNEEGVFCWDAENLLVCGNSILTNGIGIKLLDCQGSIYQNNFINNTLQVNSDGGIYGNDPSVIVWHNGSALQGNFWSDYNGTDVNNDGIGDVAHVFDLNYTDRYPLMTPISVPEFDADENQTEIETPALTPILVVIASGTAIISVALLVYFKKRKG